jgi:hypothetical protein
MSILVKCPECQTKIRVREEYAGKRMKCPKCQGPVPVPAAEPAAEEEAPVVVKPSGSVACPECGKFNRATAPVCRFCRAPLRDDVDQSSSEYEPCPRCGATGAKRVLWTPWGSFYGPAMFTHVRCPECGYGYNGRTGASNLIPAIIFVTVPLIGIILIVAVAIWVAISSGIFK